MARNQDIKTVVALLKANRIQVKAMFILIRSDIASGKLPLEMFQDSGDLTVTFDDLMREQGSLLIRLEELTDKLK